MRQMSWWRGWRDRGGVEERGCPGVEIERVSWPEDELELEILESRRVRDFPSFAGDKRGWHFGFEFECCSKDLHAGLCALDPVLGGALREWE